MKPNSLEPEKRMKVYAITGGIASGKSTVTRFLREKGFVVIDADEVVRVLYQPGLKIYQAIVAAFGTGILEPSGEIDRRKLGALIFGSSAQRERLNAATHPIIQEEMERLLSDAEAQGATMVFVDSPLLIEMGHMERYDAIILVYVEPQIQLERLMLRNHLSREEALLRIESQMPLAQKKSWADFLLDNGGDLKSLEHQVEMLLAQLGGAL